MIREKAVRQMVSHISSTTVTRRLHMISSAIGSASMAARACACDMPGRTRSMALASPMAMRRLPAASTRRVSPGATTVVASRSSTMAGPATSTPSGKA